MIIKSVLYVSMMQALATLSAEAEKENLSNHPVLWLLVIIALPISSYLLPTILKTYIKDSKMMSYIISPFSI